MYVIVEIQGQQFKAEAGRKLYVHRLASKEGDVVEFDKVLLVDNDGAVKIGSPLVEGAKVVCEVLAHMKGEKVIVFKKKRRKGYRKRNGHRQCFTQVKINEIVA
ncbi:MAG: 50S ribosomal protein L21 [Candidatus Azobacteroides sp.]|nr:50S ribosomal protein L21 [Candidatus Azobacteroides sp.]